MPAPSAIPSVATSTLPSAPPDASAVSVPASTEASAAESTIASASAAASAPASAPRSTIGGPHVPTAGPVEEQTSDGGHPLPPDSRQPGTQLAVAASHTRPEVAPPQSASVAQPQASPATQRAPPRSARHPLWFVVVHSTQVFVSPAHTNRGAQS